MIPVVYHPKYNYGKTGIHPFDGNKYAKIMDVLMSNCGKLTIHSPREPVSRRLLEHVHTPEYLEQLNDPSYVSVGIDFPYLLDLVPAHLIEKYLLEPMRWNVAGTLLAADLAIEHGAAINVGGGYHHARKEKGWGGCFYADIPLAIARVQARGIGRVCIIDLDAHQGDGTAEYAADKPDVKIFDMYNANEFPFGVSESADCQIPLEGGHLEQRLFGQRTIFGYPVFKLDPFCFLERVEARAVNDAEYLSLLRDHLPEKLDAWQPDLVIYNAGSDIHETDPWGCMNISTEGLILRDQFVFEEVYSKRKIPILLTLSGGYSRRSAEIIAASLTEILNRHSLADRSLKKKYIYSRRDHFLQAIREYPADLEHLKTPLLDLFDQVTIAFDNLKLARKNFLHIKFVLCRLLERLDYPGIDELVFKSPEKAQQHAEIWKAICQENGW